MKLEDLEYSPAAAAASRARVADPAAAQRQRLAQARAESQRLARQIAAQERAQAAPLASREDVAKALLRLQAVTGVKVGVEKKRNKKGTRL